MYMCVMMSFLLKEFQKDNTNNVIIQQVKNVLFMNKPFSCIEFFESIFLKRGRYGLFL